MRLMILGFCLLFVGESLLEGNSGTVTEKQGLRIVTFAEFEAMVDEESEKLRIYNFWATWCAPCVKEMPYFEAVQQEDSSVELVFVSMDDARKPERVTNFIARRNIQSPVVLLNDVDFNKWIDRVNPDWSGAIPATMFVKPDGEKYFHEGELEEAELKELIDQLN